MSTLKTRIDALAETFAAGVVAAIRGASLKELMAEQAPRRGPGRPAKVPADGGTTAGNPGPRKRRGRLARRNPAQIEQVVGLVVAALKGSKTGLRSEQLQKALRLDKKEITGPLVQALAAKKITKKGQKRSTTYFAK